MNKLKVLYDVVTVMQNKETLSGILTAQVHKDEEQLLALQNEFEKNLQTGQTKAKINTEFTKFHSDECNCREFFRSLNQGHGAGCRLKGKLTKLAFAMSILNALQVSEQDGKTMVISLNFVDLSEDAKALFGEKIRQARACRHEHGGMKECCAVENFDGGVNIFVNKNFEVEKIVLSLNGSTKDGQSAKHKLAAQAELSFVW